MRVLYLAVAVSLAGCGLFQPSETADFTGYASEEECLYDKALYESFGSIVELFHPISTLAKAVLTTSLDPCTVAVSVYRQKHEVVNPLDVRR